MFLKKNQKNTSPNKSLRITRRVERSQIINFEFNNQLISAHQGETIAIALLANEIRTLSYNAANKTGSGLFCAMGVCQQCLVKINEQNYEACRTHVMPDMKVYSVNFNNE
ncbi:(2Fe-2S)-binding protein [Aliikangiella sp. IMCC44359]|uniref:(2Fe-2S)-binding protein n=1 Tax=Aliikangiella sp. IMCC44359 TaxID=3459125 RepID=UPI00403AAD68